MKPNNLTATIWFSPYRLSYTTSDHEFKEQINKSDPDSLTRALDRLYAFLIIEGYSPLVLHTEH